MSRDGLYKQQGSPYWWASFTDGSGKRRRRSTRCTNKRDADRVRATWMTEAGKGLSPLPVNTTYREGVADLESDYAQKGNRSWPRVERALAHLKGAFGGAKLVEITTDRIRQYLGARLEAGASPATRRYELAILRRMLRVAWRNGKLATVPAFPTVTVNNAREEYITDSEFTALQIELPAYLRGLCAFQVYTGWRRTEVQTLTWDQVDWVAGLVWLRRGMTKNNEPRAFPFNNYPELKQVLTDQRELTDQYERELGREIPWVFSRSGSEIKSFHHAWRSACRRVGAIGADGLPKIPHDMRRSTARRLEQAGVPRSTSLKLIGHKTDSIFRRYVVVATQDLEAATAKLADLRHSIVIVDPKQEEIVER